VIWSWGEFHLFFKVVVAHRAVFAGVGEDLGAIDRDRELAYFEDLRGGGEFEDLVEARGEQIFVFASEFQMESWSG